MQTINTIYDNETVPVFETFEDAADHAEMLNVHTFTELRETPRGFAVAIMDAAGEFEHYATA